MVAGILGRSQALVADSLNSLLDIVANAVVWLGIRIANRPPDDEHPYGHGNADNLAAIFVAVVLVLTGGYIGFEAVHSIIDKNFQTPTYLATSAAALTILIKEILYHYTLRIGKRFKSPAVIANAYDHRSDVIVSAGALVGIVVAQLGYPVLDPLAGLWVAFFILKQGAKIIRENIPTLMVTSPGSKIETDIGNYIKNLDGVVSVVWIRGRAVGSSYYLDTAVNVNGNMSVKAGHDIASEIKRKVQQSFPDVADILVHIEPDPD